MNTSKVYNWLVLLIGVLGYWYVIRHLMEYNDWKGIFGELVRHPVKLTIIWVVQLLLLALNLTIEALKWKALIHPIHQQSFQLSVKQIFTGFTAGSFTPARLGDPFGRLYQIPAGKRINILTMGYISSFLQNSVIFLFGILSILLLFRVAPLESLLPSVHRLTFLLPHLLITLFILSIGYLILKKSIPIRIQKWIRFMMERMRSGERRHLWKAVLYTVLRYLVFSTQLFIWLVAFGVSDHLGTMSLVIPFYFFIITLVPSFFVTELGIRGSVALFVFGMVSSNPGKIAMVVFSLWLVNVAVPTLVGGIIHLGAKDKVL